MIQSPARGVTVSDVKLRPIPETARVLGISRRKVFELLRDGRLDAVRISSHRLVVESSINELLNRLSNPK